MAATNGKRDGAARLGRLLSAATAAHPGPATT
jgi:hypothetical protein